MNRDKSMKNTIGKKTKTLSVYKSYNFIDKDPSIDIVRTITQQSGKSYKEIYESGGPTISCQRMWYEGKTRRPQFCTIAAAARAAGGELYFVNSDGTSIKLPDNKKK